MMENESQTSTVPQDATEASPRPRRKRWVGILQIAISIGILAWLLSRVGVRDVIDALSSLDPWYYALAGLVFLVSIAVRAVRWYVLLVPLGVRTPMLELFRLYLLGFFWNSFLPSGFGGDVVKAIALRNATGRGGASVTSVLAERVVGLLATSLIGVMVIPFSPTLFPPEAIYVVVGMCVAIIVGIWVVRLDILTWIGVRLPFLGPVVGHRWAVSIQQALQTYDLKALGMGLLSSIPFTLCSILDNYLVGLALNVDLSILYYAIYTPIISIVSLLPLSFNGLGVREYTYQVLFGMVGISPEQAIAMALMFNLLRFGAGLLGGLVSFLSGVQRLVNNAGVNSDE
jgi:uncharacterized membrane protein YbhN (UPF0104 family)